MVKANQHFRKNKQVHKKAEEITVFLNGLKYLYDHNKANSTN